MKRTFQHEYKASSSDEEEEDEYQGWRNAGFCAATNFFGGVALPVTARSSTLSAPIAVSRSSSNANHTNSSNHTNNNNNKSLTEGERLLANEMKHLSLVERENVFEDIHGVVEVRKETPELLQFSLTQLDECLGALRRNREGFDKVSFMNPLYARDQVLRICFLRATEFNASEAAVRLCEHFETKLKLFGIEKIARDIVWDDLPKDAKRSLEGGAYLAFSDWKDRSGRVVSCDMWANWRYKTVESQVMAMWWISMHAVRDLYKQHHNMGIVLIPMTLGVSSPQHFMRAAALSKYNIGTCFPYRVSGFHACCANERYRPLFSLLISILPKTIRLRTKMHFGSMMECEYAMNSFGIDASMVALAHMHGPSGHPDDCFDDLIGSSDGSNTSMMDTTSQTSTTTNNNNNNSNNNTHLEAHQRRLQELWDHERDRRNHVNQFERDIIRFPSVKDIVLGRGVPYQKFPGNLVLTKLLDTDVQSYTKATTRREKTMLTERIMNHIHATGGRFVKRDASGGFWTIVDSETARQKVAMGYRNLARRDRDGKKKVENVISYTANNNSNQEVLPAMIQDDLFSENDSMGIASTGEATMIPSAGNKW